MSRSKAPDPRFAGQGEMAALGRSFDWAATPLGPVQGWPADLRVVVRTCLDAALPMDLWCEPKLTLIYNDPYRRLLGRRHPGALGRSYAEVWPELWDQVEPMFAQLRASGPPIYAEDAPFVLERDAEA